MGNRATSAHIGALFPTPPSMSESSLAAMGDPLRRAYRGWPPKGQSVIVTRVCPPERPSARWRAFGFQDGSQELSVPIGLQRASKKATDGIPRVGSQASFTKDLELLAAALYLSAGARQNRNRTARLDSLACARS